MKKTQRLLQWKILNIGNKLKEMSVFALMWALGGPLDQQGRVKIDV